ncbi:MAG: trigger factor [Candidatus Omnitrophica bacterium]|nr:trigger factor [Candidatus Omnitrophota bacterium]
MERRSDMKSRMKKLKGTARQLDIEMSKEAVDSVFSEVLEDIRRNAKIPGFRPGKAPMDIIQKNYRQDAEDEVKQRLIPRGYQMALDEHEITPVSYPEVSDVSFELSGTLKFRAKVDSSPDVNLKKYKGYKINKKKVTVTDEEVEETLERIRNMNAEFSDTDGPIEKGQFGICNVETFVNGESVSKEREDMWIEADKESSLFGMGEELIGLKKGDTKEIEVTLPEKYPDEKYAGKKAIFKVEVKQTKKKELPAVDDELAKKMGRETMPEAKEEIKKQLLARKEANERINMKNQVMETLLKKHSFEIPSSMVERQLKVLMEKAENELLQKGVDKANIESHKEKLESQLRKEAENKVRLYFILDEIASAENVEVSDSEVEEWLKRLAASYSQSYDDVKKYYNDNNLISGLKEQLREEKTLDLLVDEATVTEK